MQRYDFYYGDIKTDLYATDKDWVTVRYSQGTLNGFEPSALPLPAVGAVQLSPGTAFYRTPERHGTLACSPVRPTTNSAPCRPLLWRVQNLTRAQNIAQHLGIPGINVPPGDPDTSGHVSVLSVTGYRSLGDNSAASEHHGQRQLRDQR